MIEILVALVIIAFGLLGLAGLQTRLQVSEFESYQRSQALLLLDDMVSRMGVNRANAAAYLGNTVGVGVCTAPAAPATRAQTDLYEWCNALQGAAETQGGNRLGAMIGARGCVEQDVDTFRITVAWQGLVPLGSPALDCGRDAYNGGAGSVCTGDGCRRIVTAVVRYASLAPVLP